MHAVLAIAFRRGETYDKSNGTTTMFIIVIIIVTVHSGIMVKF
jgi:hypothetical protein